MEGILRGNILDLPQQAGRVCSRIGHPGSLSIGCKVLELFHQLQLMPTQLSKTSIINLLYVYTYIYEKFLYLFIHAKILLNASKLISTNTLGNHKGNNGTLFVSM